MKSRWTPTLVVAFVVLLGCALPSSARADSPVERAERAVARARVLGLADQTAWRRLLLYETRSDGRNVSSVDGADFFLAERGRENPAAELEATLRGFFASAVGTGANVHALCKFPARRLWLDAQLSLAHDLPSPACPALARYAAEMDPESVTFVYASNFVDNPASAFGHTLLRIVKKGSSNGDSPQMRDRRDHGVDYTARTDTKNPFLYAFKGLTGAFTGLFRFLAYDDMLRDYAGYEARDLWEYQLALTRPELELLVHHLWELANTRIDYFYLTENCSYQLVAAIDAAAPRLDLINHLRRPVLPLDTLKVVAESAGLVRSIVYRPSVRSVFRASHARLDERGRERVDALLVDADALLPPDVSDADAALYFDTAKLGLEARFAKAMVDGQISFARSAWDRLTARREGLVGVPQRAAVEWAPEGKEPHSSHGSMRAMLAHGVSNQYGSSFTAIGFRIALHDLADPVPGEPELLQLQFLDTRLRYDYGRQKLTLDSLTFAELVALNPLSRFDKKFSWRIRAAGSRLHDRAAPDAFAHGPSVSIGGALGTASDRVLFFVMADAYAVIAGGLDGIDGSIVRAGVGPFGGLRLFLPASTVALVTGNVAYLPGQSLEATFDVRANLRSRLAKNVAVGLEGNAQPRNLELQLGSYFYF